MMKNLDCNQIMIVINLEIIGEEDKNKKLYLFFFNLKFFYNLAKSQLLNLIFIIYIYIYIYI